MNHLKFRAWHKEYKQMAAVFSLYLDQKTRGVDVCYDNLQAYWPEEEIILMQSTGLRDS